MAKLEDVIQRGTTANKPAATAVAVGTLYYDTDLVELQRSNGTTWDGVEGAGGSGGDSTRTGALASAPANSNDGDLYLPNDSPYVLRDTGAAYGYWGPIWKMTRPVDGDFSWVNQGGASVDATRGSIFLTGPASTTDNWRMRVKAVPSPPYTLIVAFTPLLVPQNYLQAAVVLRDSASGKHVSFGVASSVTNKYEYIVQKWTSTTTFSASYTNTLIDLPSVVWFKVVDDNTNRICSFSHDGYNYQQLHTVARTDWITPTHIGFGVDAANATWAASMTLLSWAES